MKTRGLCITILILLAALGGGYPLHGNADPVNTQEQNVY